MILEPLDIVIVLFLKYFDTFPDDIEPIEVEHYFSEPLLSLQENTMYPLLVKLTVSVNSTEEKI